MTARSLLRSLWEFGIDVELTDDGQHIKVPANTLTPDQRAQVIALKPELIVHLVEASTVAARLMVAAMRVCDRHGDSEAARADMRSDILATPPHHRRDLLDHFNGVPVNRQGEKS